MSPKLHAGPPEAPVRFRLLQVLVAVFAFAGLFGWLTKSMLDALGPKEPVQEARERVPHPRVKKQPPMADTARPRPAATPPPTSSARAETDPKPAYSIVSTQPQPSIWESTQPRETLNHGPIPSMSLSARAGDHPNILGHVRLEGIPPANPPLPLDPNCGRLNTAAVTQPFYVVSPEGDLADVFVYVREAPAGVALPKRAAPAPALLDQAGCQYLPYVSAIQTGQLLVVRNSDPLLHNVHVMPAVDGNKESNKAQLPKGADLAYQFDKPEIFLKFKCDVHSWMFAYVCVTDHAAFSVSSERGLFYIPQLPPGRYTLEAIHRKAGSLTQAVELTTGKTTNVEFVFRIPGSNQTAPRTARVP